MKRTLFFLTAFTLAATLLSADKYAYLDWSEPSDAVASVVGLSLKMGGQTLKTDFKVDALDTNEEKIYSDILKKINEQEIPENAKTAFTLAAGAMAQAIYATVLAQFNDKCIDALSASVETLVSLTAADKVDAQGRVISKGNIDSMRQKMLAKKKSIQNGGSSSTGEGSSADPIQIKVTEFNYDTKEFEQRTDTGSNQSKMALKGYKDLETITPAQAGDSTKAIGNYLCWIPITDGKDNNLSWKAWGGIDDRVLETLGASAGNYQGAISIKDFSSGSTGGCDLKFQKMLTDANDPDYASARTTHSVLTRVNDNGTYKLHYMNFDTSTIGGSGFGVDDMSVTTNTANGAVSQGVLSLYGYSDAETEAAESEDEAGFIPYVDGSEELKWAGFSEFFNESVFKTDENGKIILNGVEQAGEDDIMVVTAKRSSSGESTQSVEVKKLDGDVFEADSSSKVSLSGWGDTATTYLFEDEDDDAAIELPVKAAVTGGNELEWRVVGGIDHTFFEIDADTDHKVEVKGWNDSTYDCADSLDKMLSSESDTVNRQRHAFLSRYNTGSGGSSMHWVSIDNVLPQAAKADNVSITTNTANGAVAQGQLSIVGFTDAQDAMETEESESGYIPYVGADGALDWTGFSTFFNENVFALDADGHIILAGLDDLEADDIAIVTATGEDTEQTISVSKLDGAEFQKDSTDKLTLKGFGETHSTYLFASSSDDGAISVPVETGSGSTKEIAWRKVGGIDTGALEVDATSHKVTLKGFNTTAADCETTLSSMLTDEADEENRDTHELLARYSGGTDDTVHWVKIGDMIEMPTVAADNCTITTNEAYGAVENGQLSLYDFATANESATEANEPYIPYADGDDTLGWAAFSSFFASSVFKKSEETGKILLNGTSESGKVKVLTLTGNGGDDQTLGTLAFDNASIDGNPSINAPVQLHAFNTAPSPYVGTQNFADALTNTSLTIQGMSVPVRVPDQTIAGGYAVKYVPMGKVTGIPSAAIDNKTITIDDEDANNPKLQIIGAKTAEEGYVLQMGAEHTAQWKKIASDDNTGILYPQGVGSGEENDEPIQITTHNDGTYGIGLRNWDTETQEFIYGAVNNRPTQIKFDETIEVNDDEEIEIAGYSDAEVGSLAYKSSTGLDWLDLPNSGSALLSLTKNSTPEAVKLGETLQKETVAGEKVVNVKNFTSGGNCSATLSAMMTTDSTNRGKHQLMARYQNGSGYPSVHWVSLGDAINGGGAPVDGVSITTNTAHGAVENGVASLRGYSTQSRGAIPFKGASNIQWIAPPSSGSALLTMNASGDSSATTVGQSLAVNSSTLNVSGFSGASSGDIPYKNDSGSISWMGSQEIEVVTSVSYNTSTHKLTYHTTKYTIPVISSEDGSDYDVFTSRARTDLD